MRTLHARRARKRTLRLPPAGARRLATLASPGTDDPLGWAQPPKQAVIVAAGLGSRLRPFTEELPKCFVPVAGKPMIEHALASFRSVGVENFVIVKGYKGDVFEERKALLGDGVSFVDNPDYASTEVLQSFLASEVKWEESFYAAYSDIVFADSVMQDMEAAEGDVCVAVDVDFRKVYNGRHNHPFAQCEAVSLYKRGWAKGTIKEVGKGKVAHIDDADGEMIGLFKFSARGRIALQAAIKSLSHKSREGEIPEWALDKMYLSELLQTVVDEGLVKVVPVPIWGNWREVDTPHDLRRANNSMMYLNDQRGRRELIQQMGRGFLSEANDLKRPVENLAREMDVDVNKVHAFTQGKVELDTAYEMMVSMSKTYPVALTDLWMEQNDTRAGVRIFTAAESKSTERILSRPDKTGELAPYYAYRDSAMSRLGPFRPEWIEELRVVGDNDAENPDVVYNNGHLMMQTTFFIGPVNFYYELRGKKYCFEANTGDSNFISPFVKHSFASRDPDQQALIIAVTYGGSVRAALSDFARMGGKQAETLSGDLRDEAGFRSALLGRYLASESVTADGFANVLAPSVGGMERASALVTGAAPTQDELQLMAGELSVPPSTLMVTEGAMQHSEEVVVTRRASQAGKVADPAWIKSHPPRPYPDTAATAEETSYIMEPLARTPHQPNLKTFNIEVTPNASPGEVLTCGLHQFLYVHGEATTTLQWGENFEHENLLRPGDSAYIAPLVQHRFNANTSSSTEAAVAEMYAVRIPGRLTDETWREFATFQPNGRERVGNESMRWY
jgi:choline kinase